MKEVCFDLVLNKTAEQTNLDDWRYLNTALHNIKD